MAGKATKAVASNNKALQEAMARADAQDLRRQAQIKNQMARMDSMKELIQQLAGEIRMIEDDQGYRAGRPSGDHQHGIPGHRDGYEG